MEKYLENNLVEVVIIIEDSYHAWKWAKGAVVVVLHYCGGEIHLHWTLEEHDSGAFLLQ